MQNYKNLIDDYYKRASELRAKLVEEIRSFVGKYGVQKGEKVELLFDGEIDSLVSFPTALMLTDRRMDSYSWESIDSIFYKLNSKSLVFSSEYGDTDSDYLLIGDLLDLYESLLDIESEIQEENLIAEDGEITVSYE